MEQDAGLRGQTAMSQGLGVESFPNWVVGHRSSQPTKLSTPQLCPSSLEEKEERRKREGERGSGESGEEAAAGPGGPT